MTVRNLSMRDYPTFQQAAQECASYLVCDEERADLIERLRQNYDVNSFADWMHVVRTWFRGSTHVYCAAFVLQSGQCEDIAAEIEPEIESIARELADEP